MSGADGGGMLHRDLTDDVLTLLDECGGSLLTSDMEEELAETKNVVRMCVRMLEDLNQVRVVRDGSEDWYVKRING